jgi:ribosome maturation factor RimP
VYRDIPAALGRLIEPVVLEHGLELVDVDLVRGRGPWMVRVIVDTLEGDGRVPIGRCAALSRELGSQLEAADAIPSRYTLEVSSPGLDRRLSREKDFLAACGCEVFVETREPLDGRRRFRGKLRGFEAGVAHMEVDGKEAAIPFAAVSKANTIYQFSRADFARPAKAGNRSA